MTNRAGSKTGARTAEFKRIRVRAAWALFGLLAPLMLSSSVSAQVLEQTCLTLQDEFFQQGIDEFPTGYDFYCGTFSDEEDIELGFFLILIDPTGMLTGAAADLLGGSAALSGQVSSGTAMFSGTVGGMPASFDGTVGGGRISGDWSSQGAMGTFSGTLLLGEGSAGAQVLDAQVDTAVNAVTGQRNNFYRRMENRRSGTAASGVDVNGLAFDFGGQSFTADMLTSGERGLARLGSALGRAFDDRVFGERFGRTSFVGEDDGGVGLWAEPDPAQELEAAADALPGAHALQSDGSGGAGGGEALGGSGWGAFLNGNISIGERDTTAAAAGSGFSTFGLSSGADYRFGETFFAGLGLGYTRDSTDFKGTGAGTSKSNAVYLVEYGSNTLFDNGYIDHVVSLGWIGFDTERSGGSITSTVNGGQVWAGLTGGYNFPIGALSVGPYLRLNGGGTFLPAYAESGAGGAVFAANNIWGVSLVLGGRADYAFNTNVGVFIPYFRLEYEHEFGAAPTSTLSPTGSTGGQQVITSTIDRDVVNLGLGASTVLARGWSGFVDYDVLLAATSLSRHSITLGVRKEF